AAVVAVVNPQRTLVDRIDRRFQDGDAAELVRALVPIFDPGDGTPEAIFVFGSAGDLSSVLSLLRSAVASPVVSAAEADLALARGAALAAAAALSGWEARAVPPPASRPRSLPRRVPGVLAVPRKRMRVGKVGALTSVLAAAVLTFVVSLSLALTLDPTPQGDSSDPQAREVATAAGEPPMVAKAPVPSAPAPTHFGEAQSGPIPPPEAVPPPETVAAAPAPAPEAEPVYDAPEAAPAAPPPVYGPVETVPAAPAPEPVYVPPNPPVYTPPPPPRLRDRIIEKIPILNRFHEPQYP
ncbi:MAG TPA: hypothetical protein VLU24_08600, partial [Mycobacterium sp.]|nr:hypothetical protein [Mycobacterium sp.]